MSDRALQLILVGLGTLLVSAHVAIKPGFDKADIRRAAEALGATNNWSGRMAEDFELPLADRSMFHLMDHIGREVVVLNFFATWCEPCRREMPELQHYASQLKAEGKPFVLVGVDAQEPREQVIAFMHQLDLHFPAAIDATGDVLKRFEVDAFPTTIVIGADGRVKLYEAGAISNADIAFAKAIPPELAALSGHAADAQAVQAAVIPPPPRLEGGWTPPSEPKNEELTGRALGIAQAMPCPCGCDDKVTACRCHTARAIKARLKAGLDDKLKDGEIMERLNREFCMKGM